MPFWTRIFALCAALGLLAGIGCAADPALVPLAGSYTRAAFHLVVLCPDADPRVVDLLYPGSREDYTFRFHENGSRVTVTWGAETLASGWREGNDLRLTFTRRDPFTGPIEWRFYARVRDDLRFHERTVAGRIGGGTYSTQAGECAISPHSVAWFTTRPRNLEESDRALHPRANARAEGDWSRFVWFLDAGPFPMSHPRAPRGPEKALRLFSFASTGGGRITSGNQVAFVDNGFSEIPWEGAAEGSSLTFPQHENAWELDYAQDVLHDDGLPRGLYPGIRRVLAGFVTGTFRVLPEHYPEGWEGETGLLPMETPGMAYWLDVDRGPNANPQGSSFAAPIVVTSDPHDAYLDSPAIVIDEGQILLDGLGGREREVLGLDGPGSREREASRLDGPRDREGAEAR